MPVVAITGVSGALGRRVVTRFAKDSDWSVVGLDRFPFPAGVAKPRHFIVHRVDLASAPLEQLLGGADALIHLSTVGPDEPDAVAADAAVLRRTLAAAAATGIRTVVVLSSAVVYGARPDNPVPLTEASPIRADVAFTYATQKISAEAITRAWAEEHPEVAVSILRPTTTLGHPDARAWLARIVQPNLAERLASQLPPLQYVHVDDVADAIVHALTKQLHGVFNVSADDWLLSEQAHELLGPNLRFPVPEQFVGPLRWASDAVLGRRRPAGAGAYSQYPWVVANDLLRATGWAPRSSSAEALVAAKPPSMFGRLYARRRQEVTLALTGAAGLLGAGAAVAAVRWWRRRLLHRSG